MISKSKVGNNFSISVVIPAYNSENTILKALESIRTQTVYPDFFEIIVVDDGSTDYTAAIVEKYFKQHSELNGRLIKQKNSGVSVTRNKGIYEAKGKWISLLDSDDIFHPNKNEVLMNFILLHEDADFVGGNLTLEKTKIPFIGELPNIKKIRPKELLIKWVPQTSTVMMKKKVFHDVGGYDESMHYAEDGDLYLKIAEKYNYYVIQKQLAFFSPDNNKLMFGESGLSGNLNGMFIGNIQILIHALKRKTIVLPQFMLFFLWNSIKYLRRVVITKVRRRQ